MPRVVPTDEEVADAQVTLARLGDRGRKAWYVLSRLEVTLDILADPVYGNAIAADSYRRARAFLRAFDMPDPDMFPVEGSAPDMCADSRGEEGA